MRATRYHAQHRPEPPPPRPAAARPTPPRSLPWPPDSRANRALSRPSLLGPAGSVALRTASKRLNRAWWGHLRRWIEHQLGDRGWLATDHWRWWKTAARHGYAAAFQREHFLELHAVFAAAVRNAFALHLDPHLAAAAPLLAAPGPRGGVDTVERLSPRHSAPLLEQYRQRLGRLRWRKLWEKAWGTVWCPGLGRGVLSQRRPAPPGRAGGGAREPPPGLQLPPLQPRDRVGPPVPAGAAHGGALRGRRMPRAPPAFPPAPQLPNLRPERQRFLEGSRAFRAGRRRRPRPTLAAPLQPGGAPSPRPRPPRSGPLPEPAPERGSRVDCLMLVPRGAGRHHRGAAPRVLRRGRRSCAHASWWPSRSPRFERIGLRYLYRCGRSRGECVWCRRSTRRHVRRRLGLPPPATSRSDA